MTSNPAAAVRMLVIYSICVPLAALVGWMACNQMDFGTLGFFGLIAAVLISPLIIQYHYPLMVFGLGAPVYCFFLKGNPPLWQVVVILSLGVAVIDRTLNSEKRFLSVPTMTWPLLFTLAVTWATSQMTGGIGLKTLGGAVGGGKKYLALFIGVAIYFALTSRVIPRHQRKLYIVLFFLAGLPSFLSDMFPFLPTPLNYINLLIPPSGNLLQEGATRFGSFASTASVIATYMLVRYGLTGILSFNRPIRFLTFFAMLVLTMIGGYRIVLISYICILTMLFFLEGLHRTSLMMIAIFGVLVGGTLMVPFADKLPTSFQRTLSFLPFIKIDEQVMMDADGSKKWRERMWADTWPKVPQYLLLGKGYSLSEDDYQMMGQGAFVNGKASQMDASMDSLAISGDYHNGPLSTLMPFGIWGAVAFIWVAGATLFVLYRNYRYGDPELKTVNAYLLVAGIQRTWGFFLLFGSFSDDIGGFARYAGLSIAMNWCICGPAKESRTVQRIKPLPTPQPA